MKIGIADRRVRLSFTRSVILRIMASRLSYRENMPVDFKERRRSVLVSELSPTCPVCFVLMGQDIRDKAKWKKTKNNSREGKHEKENRNWKKKKKRKTSKNTCSGAQKIVSSCERNPRPIT